MLKIKVISTGSQKGNCYLLEYYEHDQLKKVYALDCGNRNFDQLLSSEEKHKLQEIIISHRHVDHVLGLNTFTLSKKKNNPKDAYWNAKIVMPYEKDLNRASQEVVKIEDKLDKTLIISKEESQIILKAFDVHHDIMDWGYVLNIKGYLILYATDVGDYESVIMGYAKNDEGQITQYFDAKYLASHPDQPYYTFDAYILECNHDPIILKNKAKEDELILLQGGTPKLSSAYYTRAPHTHLSTLNFQKLIAFNYDAKPTLLVHRSDHNLPFEYDLGQVKYYPYQFINDIENQKQHHFLYVAINHEEQDQPQYHTTRELILP